MGERRGTKALELWCRRMVEDYNVRIDNMTVSWRDGLAFCALVSKCLSLKGLPCDLIRFDELKKENIYHNNELAFRVAEEILNIPSLLDPADMLAYETPDKLSILTYLSQFYQVFGAQENSLRLSKRSSTEANKSSTSSAPASKMAYVPKREPCIKCNNPVFFAERLVIEDQLYHRTCFKCARCSSVLTLGNFYQTEKDHEFCCETCPDEERARSTKNNENRLSIAQRIALFEKETSSVLKKSVSDEEKSKSLSRQLPATSPSAQGLSKFLSTQIDAPNHAESDEDEKTVNSLSSDSEADYDERRQAQPEVTSLISDSNVNVASSNINHVDSTKEEITLQQSPPQHAAESQKSDLITTDDFNDLSNLQDDIELEFERLAEEAVNSPIAAPIVVIQKPSPPQIIKEEIIVADQIDVSETKAITEEIEEVKSDVHVEEEINSDVHEEIQEIKTDVHEVKEEKVLNQIDSIEENKTVYPGDLNPFGDDDMQEDTKTSVKRPSLNPFGSCSEDEEISTKEVNKSINTGTLPKPPRPPPPKASSKPASTNPFGSDDEEEKDTSIRKTSSVGIRTPVPTPRRIVSITPEPSFRANFTNSPGQSFKGSTSSLASSTEGAPMRRKKNKAPLPPTASSLAVSDDRLSKTPSTTPKKKRPAPTPPTSTPLPVRVETTLYVTASNELLQETHDVSLKSENTVISEPIDSINDESSLNSTTDSDQRRLIPLEESLIEEGSCPSISSVGKQEEVTYRRKIIPLTDDHENGDGSCENVETTKDNKEAENRHRQSQCSLQADSSDSLPYINKSSHGKWKRRKGPAPALPGFAQPQRRVLQMLPLQEIRHELEVIEVQQQGLEKQGVMLEKMIRERCEGTGDNRTTEELLESLPNAKNPKEVEELILQLFEIVNEKNELFRRQAELMYLRRAHRLEEEQADAEFEIRTLMAQPECNKTDSDKAREEVLIARLVEIVSQRNAIVDCLEMDRLREAEEDMSIKQRMESHTAKLDQEYLNQTPTKLSKKEKKKLKEAKKLKNKKVNDADKDMDTSELKAETTEKKKKKKKFLF